ncbi:MAG: isoamylase early set domain-containing protein [Solirubrobacterales bacterium]
MSDERDELIERVRATLREPPEVDSAAMARLLVAVAAERERTREHARVPARGNRWTSASAGLVAAILLVSWFGLHSRRRDMAEASTIAAATGRAASMMPAGARVAAASNDARDAGSIRSVQLVFRDPAARRVSVVGDFTDWDANQAPMERDSASGLWSVTLALRPGRHVYAFLVDDSVWVQDPRAMVAPDADFGRPGSVLLVGAR